MIDCLTQSDDGCWNTFKCQGCGLTAISGDGRLCDHCLNAEEAATHNSAAHESSGYPRF
jgi:hypothetical protein